jgi:hypothetical protein
MPGWVSSKPAEVSDSVRVNNPTVPTVSVIGFGFPGGTAYTQTTLPALVP